MNIAIIPARGGSKGIPKKNIIDFIGKPMIQYTIEAAQNSSLFSKIIVTSDSDQILEISRELGADALKRPDSLSSDECSTDPVILHTINSDASLVSANIALLQPTSPLRHEVHIKDAYDLFKKEETDCVLSVTEAVECPFKCLGMDSNGYLSGYFGEAAPFSRRQSFPEVWFPNGAIYIFAAKKFMANRCIPRSRLKPYIMTWLDSIDIDNEQDLRIAEFFYRSRCNEA